MKLIQHPCLGDAFAGADFGQKDERPAHDAYSDEEPGEIHPNDDRYGPAPSAPEQGHSYGASGNQDWEADRPIGTHLAVTMVNPCLVTTRIRTRQRPVMARPKADATAPKRLVVAQPMGTARTHLVAAQHFRRTTTATTPTMHHNNKGITKPSTPAPKRLVGFLPNVSAMPIGEPRTSGNKPTTPDVIRPRVSSFRPQRARDVLL